MTTIAEAAALIRTQIDEIESVEDHDHGVVITTRDGVRIIDIEVPDFEGKTGLAFFVRPDGRALDDPQAPPYAFPVFRPYPAEVEAVEHIDEVIIEPTFELVEQVSEPGPVPPRGNASKPAWVAYAVAQGADVDEAESLSRNNLRARYGAGD